MVVEWATTNGPLYGALEGLGVRPEVVKRVLAILGPGLVAESVTVTAPVYAVEWHGAPLQAIVVVGTASLEALTRHATVTSTTPTAASARTFRDRVAGRIRARNCSRKCRCGDAELGTLLTSPRCNEGFVNGRGSLTQAGE